jgi:integrase
MVLRLRASEAAPLSALQFQWRDAGQPIRFETYNRRLGRTQPSVLRPDAIVELTAPGRQRRVFLELEAGLVGLEPAATRTGHIERRIDRYFTFFTGLANHSDRTWYETAFPDRRRPELILLVNSGARLVKEPTATVRQLWELPAGGGEVEEPLEQLHLAVERRRGRGPAASGDLGLPLRSVSKAMSRTGRSHLSAAAPRRWNASSSRTTRRTFGTRRSFTRAIGFSGMRKSEVLNLRWSQVVLRAGAVRLEAEDTKTDEPRVVYLTDRVLAMLSEQPRLLHADFVFVNPATAKPWQDVQGAVERARRKAGLEGVWVHDLRRSFVTLSRRSGLPESVVARFSGHRTAAVFKRYNIVEEQDLKAAVQVLNRARVSAEPRSVAAGHETGTVDEK